MWQMRLTLALVCLLFVGCGDHAIHGWVHIHHPIYGEGDCDIASIDSALDSYILNCKFQYFQGTVLITKD